MGGSQRIANCNAKGEEPACRCLGLYFWRGKMYENVYHGFGPARTEAMAGRRSAAGSESVHWKEHRPFFRLTEPHSSLLYGDGTEHRFRADHRTAGSLFANTEGDSDSSATPPSLICRQININNAQKEPNRFIYIFYQLNALSISARIFPSKDGADTLTRTV